MFIPKTGEMIQFDFHILQMGWFNHQLVFQIFFCEIPVTCIFGHAVSRVHPFPFGEIPAGVFDVRYAMYISGDKSRISRQFVFCNYKGLVKKDFQQWSN